MPDVSVPWGQGEIDLRLPDSWTIQQVAAPQLRPAPKDWPDRLALALGQADTGESLGRLLAARRGGRICIIVEDLTRHSPLHSILAVLMRELEHARIEKGRIEIVIAGGMHPPITPEQAAAKLGPSVEGIAWRCNPWHDSSQYMHVGTAGRVEVLVDRGVVEADLRIIVSSVSPHLQAGFGGGYKMLLPGCSAIETIRALHRLGLGRSMRQLVGTPIEQNPMRQAIEAGGALVDQAHGKTTALQYMLDAEDMPSVIACGAPAPTQQMMAKQCSVACGVVTAAPADIVITNAYPRDYDLWQGFKSIANTAMAARPGGVIICLARCEAGLGMSPPRWPLSPSQTRAAIRLLGPDALTSLVTRLLPRLAGDAAFFVRLAARMLRRNPILLVSPVLAASKATFPGVPIYENIEQATEAATQLRGDGPQRVVVFPAGGITFPISAARPAGINQ